MWVIFGGPDRMSSFFLGLVEMIMGEHGLRALWGRFPLRNQ